MPATLWSLRSRWRDGHRWPCEGGFARGGIDPVHILMAQLVAEKASVSKERVWFARRRTFPSPYDLTCIRYLGIWWVKGDTGGGARAHEDHVGALLGARADGTSR